MDRLCSISYQLCEGLQHIHSHGIVFQDVKPGNIMITKDYIVKIIDFGIAKLCDPAEHAGSGATLTRSGSSAFTPAYAAPEQMAGARTGPWTDIHALGLLFVELVTGLEPYQGPSLIRAVLDEVRPSAAARRTAMQSSSSCPRSRTARACA